MANENYDILSLNTEDDGVISRRNLGAIHIAKTSKSRKGTILTKRGRY
jgi:hypothetical protein